MATRTQAKHAKQNIENCCRICGEFDKDILTIDHINPLAHDGIRNDSANFQKLCVACNRMKDTFSIEFPIRDHSKCVDMSASEFLCYKQQERFILKQRIESMRQNVIKSIKRTVNLADREAIKSAIKDSKCRIKIVEISG